MSAVAETSAVVAPQDFAPAEGDDMFQPEVTFEYDEDDNADAKGEGEEEEAWVLDAIVHRRAAKDKDGHEYLCRWRHGVSEPTWEKRSLLEDEGFKDHCDAFDAIKARKGGDKGGKKSGDKSANTAAACNDAKTAGGAAATAAPALRIIGGARNRGNAEEDTCTLGLNGSAFLVCDDNGFVEGAPGFRIKASKATIRRLRQKAMEEAEAAGGAPPAV